MNCEDFETLMTDALGDELAPADRPAFTAHLAGCERCRHEYESARDTLITMRELPGPPAVNVRRVGNRLVIGEPRHPSRFIARLTSAAFRYAAVILIAFCVGYGVRVQLGPDGTPQEHRAPSGETRRSDGRLPGDEFQTVLAGAHRRNPNRSDLAKCLDALFAPKQ
jgi:anti-sigma factor RsiW